MADIEKLTHYLGAGLLGFLSFLGGLLINAFKFGKKNEALHNKLKEIDTLRERADSKKIRIENLETQVLQINNILANNQRIDNEVLTAIDRLNNTITATNTTLAILNTNYQNTSKEVELLRTITAEHGNRISKIER
jgi:uncharacterized coiled-coil DUF342 family protein